MFCTEFSMKSIRTCMVDITARNIWVCKMHISKKYSSIFIGIWISMWRQRSFRVWVFQSRAMMSVWHQTNSFPLKMMNAKNWCKRFSRAQKQRYKMQLIWIFSAFVSLCPLFLTYSVSNEWNKFSVDVVITYEFYLHSYTVWSFKTKKKKQQKNMSPPTPPVVVAILHYFRLIFKFDDVMCANLICLFLFCVS